MTDTQNPFRDFWVEGEVITYLGVQMVVVAITDAQTNEFGRAHHASMTTEYVNTRDEIQTKVFYLYHIPALKVFNG